jgi:Starter unit:ACP transacylase in aflatoxin biosynthesis
VQTPVFVFYQSPQPRSSDHSVLAMAANRILLFGDSSDAPIALIRQLLAKSRHSKSTKLFIQNVVDAVGREAQELTPQERDSVGMIHSIQDLVECVDSNKDRFGIARTILLYVARTGELILYVKLP